jgi:sugar phosphate isomerase/epimerase
MYPEDAVDFISAAGCRVCEIFLNTFSEYEPEFAELLKSKLTANGLNAYSVHPMGTQFEPQLFSVCRRQKQDAVHIFEKVLKAAKYLGAKLYIMHGPAGMRGSVRSMQFDRIGPITAELCEIAASYGVTLSWENVSWCLFNTPDFAGRLLEHSKTEKLAFTLDIKQAVRSGYSPFDYLDSIGGRLANVHLCDYTDSDGLKLNMPGKGGFDFDFMRKRLEDISYKGPVMLEVYSDLYDDLNELKSSYEYIRGLFARSPSGKPITHNSAL